MNEGVKHLVQCHCILPQYRNRPEPVFHKFTVFSVVENDSVVEKISQCPNCGVIHKIIDICKSEILIGKDENRTLIEKSDLALSLPEKVIDLLETYSCDLPTWEHCAFWCITNPDIAGNKLACYGTRRQKSNAGIQKHIPFNSGRKAS